MAATDNIRDVLAAGGAVTDRVDPERRGKRRMVARGLVAMAPGLALALGMAAPASGQVAAAQLPTREELQGGAPPVEPSRTAPRSHHLRVDDNVERSPCALDDPAYAQIRIKLTKPIFDHLGPVPDAAVAASWQAYAGTDQPIAIVCRIRDSAATMLRAMGYIAAVEVPVQRIANGEVHFAVLYARVTSIRVIGQPGRDAGLLERYLRPLTAGQVFNRFAAERDVLLAQDIPGYDIRLTLKPSGSGAGNMIAEVRVADTPVLLDFTASDLAAPSTGRIGGQLRMVLNGLTGLGDQTTLSAYSTSEFRKQQIYQLGHQFMAGAGGLELSGHVTYAVTRPDVGDQSQHVDAHTLYVNAEALYPLVRRQAVTLRGALGLDIVDQKVTLGPARSSQERAPLSRDRLRVAYLRFDVDTLDMRGRGPDGAALWRIAVSAEIRRGLNILGATPDCLAASAPCRAVGHVPPGVPDGNPEATVFRASANLDLRPWRWLDLSLAPRFQLASAPVYGFEQFSLGNYTVGRGFSPGSIAGDDGAAFSVEARGPALRLSANSRLTMQPYAFSDNGWGWRRRMPDAPNPQELHSVGGGVRASFQDAGQLDLAVAIPVSSLPGNMAGNPVTHSYRPKPLFLATFSTILLPWRYR